MVIHDVSNATIPRDDQAILVEYMGKLGSDNPAMIRESFVQYVDRPDFVPWTVQFVAIGAHHTNHGELGQEYSAQA